MSIVRPALAQKMVNYITRFVRRNVNLMDSDGVIIASSDHNRVGQLHMKALEAIENNRPEVVEADGQGMKRGINVPIRYRDQICGVVGVSGDAEEIEPIIDLVRCSIELLIEQEAIMSLTQVHNQLREQFLYEWVYRQVPCSPDFVSRGEHCGVKVHVPRPVALVRFCENSHQNVLEECFEDRKTDNYRIRLSSNLYILILDADQSLVQVFDYIQSIAPVCKISVGDPEEIIHTSLLQAQLALRIGDLLHPNVTRLKYDDYRCYDWILKGSAMAGDYELLCMKAAGMEEGQENLGTLLEFFRQNGNLTLTANALDVHRNTIRYRLNRVHKLTGKNPFVFQDLFSLICEFIVETNTRYATKHAPR